KNATGQASGAHLLVGCRQLLQHIFVHQFPVWIIGGLASLLAPPNHVAGIENELGSPVLNIVHDPMSDPLAAMKTEHRASHTRKQFYIFNRRFRDPALV